MWWISLFTCELFNIRSDVWHQVKFILRPRHDAALLIEHLDASNQVPVSCSRFVSFPTSSPFIPDPCVTSVTLALVWKEAQRGPVIQNEISHVTSLFQSAHRHYLTSFMSCQSLDEAYFDLLYRLIKNT